MSRTSTESACLRPSWHASEGGDVSPSENLLQHFRVARPTNGDYYVAFGFFRALGVSDPEAHALIESVSQLAVCQEDL